ncbi:HipA domain-containing protein (plasmid) [Gemmobacter fulvus]|uniref:HipA domain-containing protein n=1 Tax=Gemmobacter fulvus TaxID=2840474 RepID=A0A975PC72_9RHOB|nr:HipA domain-containing protein [Gemmobacter fulvus]MBT9247902.1 HipA domain-containing protein [Gemmobacter fulvus]QWK93272.1 HipA domain-containing protein [Gemmobacter fulvus]
MDVWIEAHDRPVGLLTRDDTRALSFIYAEGVRREHQLSLSLPLRSEPFADADCRGYFANLLFEGPQLERILDSYKLERGDIGALLWHLGADCPGAISVTPEGSGPGKTPGRFPQDYELLEEDRLHAILLSLHLHKRLPDDARDPSPVAGVQGKIAVVAHEGRFYLPKVGSRAPTTHILKVSPAEDAQITRHEVALLKIAETCRIQIARCEALDFALEGRQIHALLSTRFDRDIQIVEGAGLITRFHAEDFCQALGLPPTLKYERNSANPAHRFSAAAIEFLALQVSVPTLFQRDILQHTLFNLLVGNSDNHGKNGSVIHQGGGTRLAPLYDVVPVFMDPNVTHQLAFRHGEAEFTEDFTQDNLRGLLFDFGFAKPQMGRTLKQIATLAVRIAEAATTLATKELADALHAQAGVIEAALEADFGLPARDFYDRISRDDGQERSGGWGGLS